jgi:hypothetical protein
VAAGPGHGALLVPVLGSQRLRVMSIKVGEHRGRRESVR